MAKAVALLSGGLDSTLAVRLILEQGIEVHALNFTSAFCTCNSGGKHGHAVAAGGVSSGGCRSEAKRVAEEFNIPIKVVAKGLDYIEIVRNPRHGYGKGINPCVDCRIYMFMLAKKYMREIGASFIVTGEVLGQRPMSQRMDAMRVIEREAGLTGLILRPLSAKHFLPTIPEVQGVVDREKLLSFSGRGRKDQIGLAKELDVNDYPCPSGGCLLTDKIFSKKVRDLFEYKKDLTKKDLELLKAGRHFRFNGAKVVVGRDESDNVRIRNLKGPEDLLIEPVGFPGPVALISGEFDALVRDFAAGLVVRYSNDKAVEPYTLMESRNGDSTAFELSRILSEDVIEGARVC